MRALALALVLLIPAEAGAQVCGDRGDMVQKLNIDYGETRKSMGLTENNHIIEIYASEETGSWTILTTSPQGLTCLMSAGDAYQQDPPVQLGEPT